jgi:hypothetical protein
MNAVRSLRAQAEGEGATERQEVRRTTALEGI